MSSGSTAASTRRKVARIRAPRPARSPSVDEFFVCGPGHDGRGRPGARSPALGARGPHARRAFHAGRGGAASRARPRPAVGRRSRAAAAARMREVTVVMDGRRRRFTMQPRRRSRSSTRPSARASTCRSPAAPASARPAARSSCSGSARWSTTSRSRIGRSRRAIFSAARRARRAPALEISYDE